MKLVVRKDVFDSICETLGIEKAGYPVNTRHGNYVKVADNPARWEFKPLTKPKESETDRRVRLANKAKLIPKNKTNQQLMNINQTNYKTKGQAYINSLNNRLSNKDYYCKINGKRIKEFTKHIYINRHSLNEKIERTKILPYVMPILTSYGVKGKYTEDPKGDFQEIIGKAEIKNDNGTYSKVGIAVIVADDGKGANEVKGISVFAVRNRLIKSFSTDAFTGNQHNIRGDLARNRLRSDFQS